eukprot:jgi/Mesvir1/1336/Mv16883-RA.1
MAEHRNAEARVDTNVLVDSKREYVDQLERSLSQPMFAAFKNILQDALNVSGAKGVDCMECLTRLLSEVPSWNADIIDEETREVQKTVPYLKELLKAYFVCASMILGSIRRGGGGGDQKLKVKVPTCERFVHSVMKMMAADLAEDMPHYVSQAATGGIKLNKRQVLTLHMSIAMAAAHSAGGGLAKPLKEKKFWVSFGFQSAALALFWMLLVPNL